MKERPILFSGPMVRAILEGRKTQTRRAIKADIFEAEVEWNPTGRTQVSINCTYGKPGERLWVRETWREADSLLLGGSEIDPPCIFAYKADNSIRGFDGQIYDTFGLNFERLKWRPSIFMPRAASRILLEITDVRVERLQDISESDARAEGVEQWPDGNFKAYTKTPGKFTYAKDAFRTLWQSINGPESWVENPWVWVIEFKRIAP